MPANLRIWANLFQPIEDLFDGLEAFFAVLILIAIIILIIAAIIFAAIGTAMGAVIGSAFKQLASDAEQPPNLTDQIVSPVDGNVYETGVDSPSGTMSDQPSILPNCLLRLAGMLLSFASLALIAGIYLEANLPDELIVIAGVVSLVGGVAAYTWLQKRREKRLPDEQAEQGRMSLFLTSVYLMHAIVLTVIALVWELF